MMEECFSIKLETNHSAVNILIRLLTNMFRGHTLMT